MSVNRKNTILSGKLLLIITLIVWHFSLKAETLSSEEAHKVLGISEGASDVDIKKAWRRLASKYHPDKNHSIDTTMEMQKVQEAYYLLSGNKKWKVKRSAESTKEAEKSAAKHKQEADAADAKRRQEETERLRKKRIQELKIEVAKYSDDKLNQIISSKKPDLEFEVVIDEILKRKNPNSILNLLALTKKNLLKISRIPSIVISKLKNSSDPKIKAFLVSASTKNYANSYSSQAETGREVTKAILAKIDEPDMLDAALKLADTHKLKISNLTTKILEGLKGKNNQKILNFLASASTKNYAKGGYSSLKDTGIEVAKAILARIDEPDMLDAALKLADTHKLEISNLTTKILEGLKGKNNQKILNFLASASTKNYAKGGYSSQAETGRAIAKAIEARKHLKQYQEAIKNLNILKKCSNQIKNVLRSLLN
jgi:curved DNA-binding protein CbpA